MSRDAYHAQAGAGQAGDNLPPLAVALSGGLGNQLFQAAAAVSLARRCNARCEFDLAFYKAGRSQRYALGPFPHGAATRNYQPIGKAVRLTDRIRHWTGITTRVPQATWAGARYEQPGFGFDPAFHALTAPCHIAGYFQSPKFFADDAGRIIEMFHPRHLNARIDAHRAMADPDNTVSVHVRRGDYVANARVAAVHGALGAGYYRDAFEALRSSVQAPRFLVFSDDLAAARGMLGQPADTTFVDGGSAAGDLWLMSLCRHHIIANSSFSWWGAFFDQRAGGRVIAPRQWFTDQALLTRPVQDLFPHHWTVL